MGIKKYNIPIKTQLLISWLMFIPKKSVATICYEFEVRTLNQNCWFENSFIKMVFGIAFTSKIFLENPISFYRNTKLWFLFMAVSGMGMMDVNTMSCPKLGRNGYFSMLKASSVLHGLHLAKIIILSFYLKHSWITIKIKQTIQMEIIKMFRRESKFAIRKKERCFFTQLSGFNLNVFIWAIRIFW